MEALKINRLLIHNDFIFFNCIQQKHTHPIGIVSHLQEFATQSAGQLLYLFIYRFSCFQENGYEQLPTRLTG